MNRQFRSSRKSIYFETWRSVIFASTSQQCHNITYYEIREGLAGKTTVLFTYAFQFATLLQDSLSTLFNLTVFIPTDVHKEGDFPFYLHCCVLWTENLDLLCDRLPGNREQMTATLRMHLQLYVL